MPRGDTLKRQWSLVQELQTHRYGITLDDLAERLGCNRRTVQRDINVLRAVGLPISFDADGDQHGQRRYALPHGYLDCNELLLTITEALSLYLARAFMAPLAGTSIGEAFDKLVERIERSLSDKTLRHFRDLQGLFLVLSQGQPDYKSHRDIVASVDTAVRERRVLKIAYRSPWRDDEYTTEIHPYGMVFWQGDLYVVAFSARAEDMRVFKIPRILRAELTSKQFSRPEDFDLEDHFSCSLSVSLSGEPFDACVQFTGPAASLVRERRWHPSQRTIPCEGDRVLIKLKISDPVGLKQWVKSFGPNAELLAPSHLRDELRQELLAAASLYAAPRQPGE